MSRKSGRQDYIARIRYQNELIAPPCPPALLDIPVDMSTITSPAFLSSILQKRETNFEVDRDLGMPLDLTEVQGIFDRGDETGVYAANPPMELDPRDRALLKDISEANGKSKSQPGVSFLRRTEYVSAQSSGVRPSVEAKRLRQQERDDRTDPEAQLQAVESMFEAANSNISELRHPSKKHLKAVEAMPLLPDLKMFDLMHLAVKLVGSASLRSRKNDFSRLSLATALFRQNMVENDEWMTMYAANEEGAQSLKRKLDALEDTIEYDEENNAVHFDRVQDNDIDLTVHSGVEELAVTFDGVNNRAMYVPIKGRANLKRRRVVKGRREIVNQNSVGAIDLSLRDITPQESIFRDNARSEYDPVSYTVTSLPEDNENDNEPNDAENDTKDNDEE